MFLFRYLLLCAAGGMTLAAVAQPPAPKASSSSVLMDTMSGELARAMGALGKSGQPPYFISYSAHDLTSFSVVAEQGGIASSGSNRQRTADVVVRVGDTKLDNTHGRSRQSALRSAQLPLADDPDAIARSLWWATSAQYRASLQAYLEVKNQSEVRAKEEDNSPDFSHQDGVKSESPALVAAPADKAAWENRMRALSAIFRSHPQVSLNIAVLSIARENNDFVSSEGSRIASQHQLARIVVLASSRADDGMDIVLARTFEAETAKDLPSQPSLEAQVRELADQLDKLRVAPAAEPFDGPAMLSGRAAAVFFHEVLGHRLESQRQRGEQEGQTFTKDVGKEILPAFLSVADDPTLAKFDGTTLSGHYAVDDEGQPAQRVELIQDGVLKQFLMSRMPIANFASSNGHGRAQAGKMPIARQGNLIVTSSKTTSDKHLREMLLEEIKKQKKPYGLYFDDISAGSTLTQRAGPQIFQVIPTVVYRVYADGRPDELIRGATIVGTPIAALTRIVATGDKPAIFNGECGAESGSISVSAIAPAMLVSDIETQKGAQGNARPPILPAPGADSNPDVQGVQ